tara:strand:+ start:529 stop:903 length:375 start_codon:yes stop_codon:yes gene_type:complete
MKNHKHSAQATVGALIGEKTLRESGSGQIAFTYTATSRTKIINFRLGTTSAPTSAGNLVLSVQNPNEGVEFACTTLATEMQDATSVFYTEPMFLEKGDIFKVEYANADSVQYGLTIVYADLEVN